MGRIRVCEADCQLKPGFGALHVNYRGGIREASKIFDIYLEHGFLFIYILAVSVFLLEVLGDVV